MAAWIPSFHALSEGERLLAVATHAAAGHGRHVAGSAAGAVTAALRRLPAAHQGEDGKPEELTLAARLGVIEAQLRVQDAAIKESGGSLPSLAVAIQALRQLNAAGNAAKHPGAKVGRETDVAPVTPKKIPAVPPIPGNGWDQRGWQAHELGVARDEGQVHGLGAARAERGGSRYGRGPC